MKRLNNIYNNILDIKEIQRIYNKRVKINTKNKKKLERFENNYVSNIIYIKNILEKRIYKPGKYNVFIIKEPKLRLIMSQNIIDKLINHVVSEYFLINVFDTMLIDENVATRKNKGTHYGIKKVKKYLNEINAKNKEFFILKFDIKKYFFNLDHEIIKKLIKKRIKDKDVLKILDDIIDSTDNSYVNERINKVKQNEINKILKNNRTDKEKLLKEIEALPSYEKGKGLPIGNMSSQIFAIMYLNELDHFIKEYLKIKYYLRYMDDGILIHEDKEYLKYCLKEIKKIIYKYKLDLNNKTKIYSIKDGFEFLGFRYYIKNNKLITKVKKQTKDRFKRKIKILYNLINMNKINYNALNQVKSSYVGHLKYGNTKNMVYRYLKKYSKYKILKCSSVIIDEFYRLKYKRENIKIPLM